MDLGVVGPVDIDVQPAEAAERPGGVGVKCDGPFEHDPGGAVMAGQRMHGSEDRKDQRIIGREVCRPVGELQCLCPGGRHVIHPVVD